ncbi:MAG: T9SS type A sorting domain-containing protein [Bacteroidales bacterium]
MFTLVTFSGKSQQLAFPTAEGSGRFAKGGRGGSVYEVTNLSNSGTGSIVDAVSQPNRTIVFRVSGTIELGNVLLEPRSNTTIAGQTAPGDGICIKGRIKIGDVSNVIIRYLRVRVDAGAPNADGDAVDIAGGPNCQNIIIDHVSASFARDEGISCRETNTNVTVQWCIISEGLLLGGGHSYGSLIRGDYGDKKSFHHNLYAHNLGRNPRPGNYNSVEKDPEGLHFDFRNNVVYNWQGKKPGYNDDTDHMCRYNFVGNVYIPGPESDQSGKYTDSFRENCLICYGFFDKNSYDGIVPDDQYSLVRFQNFTPEQVAAYKERSSLPVKMEPVRTTTPAQAKTEVLAYAGASFPKRDTIDRRIVNDVLNKTGHFIDSIDDQPEGAWPLLNSLPAPADDDHDGMPNEWELANILDPNDASDRNLIGDNGYTKLEEYLNSIVEKYTVRLDDTTGLLPDKPIITDPSSISTPNSGGFYLHQNYPNPFNALTTIRFEIASACYTTLKVFDIYGREVAVLVDGLKTAGKHEEEFNGSILSNGVYIYQLRVGKYIETKKLLLKQQ